MDIAKIIDRYLRKKVKDYKYIVENTDVSKSTYFRKIKNPESFTVGELKQIYDCLGVPKEERTI